MNMSTKFDLWLVRFSYIAQIAILFLTAFAFFYTVIPLYQNAVLQESIAKKELEVKALSNNIRLLSDNLTHESVNLYVLQVGNICSPSLPFLLKPLLVPSLNVDERTNDKEKRISEYKDALNKDIYECLTTSARSSTVLSKISREDFNRILLVLDSIKPRLNKLRHDAQNAINDDNKLKEIGMIKDSRDVNLDEMIIAMGVTPEQLKMENEANALAKGADVIFYKYGSDVMALIKDSFINFK